MAGARVPISAGLALILGAACDTRPRRPLALEIVGCAVHWADGACTPAEDRKLLVWLDDPREATWSGATPVDAEPAAGGRRYTLRLESGERVTATIAAKDAVWQGAVTLTDRQPDRAASAAARTASEPAARAQALIAAAKANEAAGDASGASDDRIVAAFTLIERQRDLPAARQVLSLPAPSVYPAGAVRRQQMLGLLARHAGDLRGALDHIDRARAHAERLGMDQALYYIRTEAVHCLHALGRAQEALAELAELTRTEVAKAPCRRALSAMNEGWIRAAEAERARRPDPQAAAALRTALGLYEGDCPDPARAAEMHANLGFVAADRGAVKEARAHLAAVRAGKPAAALAPWLMDLAARVDLLEGRAEAALSGYEALLPRAEANPADGLVWRAHLGRALALDALGRRDEAIGALEAAEAQLDAELGSVPLDAGRASFVADRERSARLLVQRLLDAGRTADAYRAARRSRSRVLRLLNPQDAGQRAAIETYRAARAALVRDAAGDPERSAADLARARSARKAAARSARAQLDLALGTQARALPERPGGVTSVVFHPVESGWVALGAGPGGEFVARAAGEPEAVARSLLQQISARVAGAPVLELMPHGALRDLDLHSLSALPPVRYAMDAAPQPRPKAGGRAVVVADPRRDLVAARAEGREVAARLKTTHAVDQLEGTQATVAAVTRAFAADLLHYAGHGVYAGPRGWDSRLPLADGDLGVGDILAAPAVPGMVVLSGCETGRSSAAGAETIGLGQAFVAAGARAVLATARPVDDAVARAVMQGFYAHLPEGPAVALAKATAAVRKANPKADWAAFRVLVP